MHKITTTRGPPVPADATPPSVPINNHPNTTPRENNMQILFINNDGGGFADYIDIDDNTTVGQFFSDKMPHDASSNYLIRVNRQPVPNDYVLQAGDRVTFTPTKIEGARLRCVA